MIILQIVTIRRLLQILINCLLTLCHDTAMIDTVSIFVHGVDEIADPKAAKAFHQPAAGSGIYICYSKVNIFIRIIDGSAIHHDHRYRNIDIIQLGGSESRCMAGHQTDLCAFLIQVLQLKHDSRRKLLILIRCQIRGR